MPDEFVGDPSPLQATDFERAARSLRCSVPALRAVAHVESAGSGYQSDGRPKILFERHWFHRFTEGRYTQAHSDISWPSMGGYRGGAQEYDRLTRAIALDREAALKSASWGAFQIMGFNHREVGFSNVEFFVAAMVHSTAKQLDAFVEFIKSKGLEDELRRLDWKGFARIYNGKYYWKNDYDGKMARAYRDFSEGGARTDSPFPVLRAGNEGQAVMHLQELLGIATDGDFGPATKAAVIAFQEKMGLHPDGIVGAQTWAALLATQEKTPSSRKGLADEARRSRVPLRLGDKGDDVAFLQQLLGIVEDGDFGPATLVAVMDFQKSEGLSADGIVGRNTWDKLLDS